MSVTGAARPHEESAQGPALLAVHDLPRDIAMMASSRLGAPKVPSFRWLSRDDRTGGHPAQVLPDQHAPRR